MNNSFFSKIYFHKESYLIRIDEEFILFAAFIGKYENFEFSVFLFGQTNAPAAFMIIINEIFCCYLDVFVIKYLNDILIYDRTDEDHIDHVRNVLSILRLEKFYAKLTRCCLGSSSISYLGHVISSNGLPVDTEKH